MCGSRSIILDFGRPARDWTSGGLSVFLPLSSASSSTSISLTRIFCVGTGITSSGVNRLLLLIKSTNYWVKIEKSCKKRDVSQLFQLINKEKNIKRKFPLTSFWPGWATRGASWWWRRGTLWSSPSTGAGSQTFSLKCFSKEIAHLNVLIKALQENCPPKTVQKLPRRSSAVWLHAGSYWLSMTRISCCTMWINPVNNWPPECRQCWHTDGRHAALTEPGIWKIFVTAATDRSAHSGPWVQFLTLTVGF